MTIFRLDPSTFPDENAFQAIASADRIYFIAKNTWEFKNLGWTLIPNLPRFDGVIVTGKYEDEMQTVNKVLRRDVPCVDQSELLQIAETHKVALVDFSTNFISLAWVDKLAQHPNIVRCDYLQAKYEIGMANVYLPVKEERAYVLSNIDKFYKLLDLFGDDFSRQTLLAWMKALILVDRRHLFPTLTTNVTEYFNSSSRQASLVPRPDEVYVDIGAASGDTIFRYVEAARGQYNKIIALEPHRKSFGSVRGIGNVLPRFKAYQYLAGDEDTHVGFHRNDANPDGSNAVLAPNSTLRQVRIDTLVPDATFIKMDVEGYEPSVLRGAEKVIVNNHPNMAVTTYHHARDFLNIIDTVEGIHHYKNIALRQFALNMMDVSYLFSDVQSFA